MKNPNATSLLTACALALCACQSPSRLAAPVPAQIPPLAPAIAQKREPNLRQRLEQLLQPSPQTVTTPWASTLLARLDPAARRKLTHQLAQDLRRQQQTRIQAQQNPDGSPYAPRKQRKNIRGKQGRIKKQKASMFNKLRTNTHLKAKADGNGLEVGFYGRVARIARVHQYGLRDRVVAGGGDVQYKERRVLGLPDKSFAEQNFFSKLHEFNLK